MNPLMFAALSMAACATAHYSVVFLEPEKASWLKAIALGFILVICSNVARWHGFDVAPLVEWTVYIVVSAGFVWALYDLKPLHNVTVGASYLAGSYLLAQAMKTDVSLFV